MKVFKIIFFSLSIFLLAVSPAALILAQPGQYNAGDPPKLQNPLANNVTSIYAFVKEVLENVVLPIGAVVVVFFIIYSGFLFVTAGGDETKLQKAKHTFLWVVVGAAVLLGAWAIALAIQNTVCQIAPAICSPTSPIPS